MAALSRVLSQMMFNCASLLILDSSFEVLSPIEQGQNLQIYIELVVVFVVGTGEDVEKSENVWNGAAPWFSTGL